MKRIFCNISALLLLGLVSGCASVEKRIENNLGYFDQLDAEDQAKIRQGQIDLGFEKPMVEMALGRPASIKHRQTVDGSFDIWIYTGVTTEFVYPNCTPYFGSGIYYGRSGRRTDGHYHHHMPVARPRSYEAARVVFEKGKVKEVEQLAKRK